MKMQPRRFSRTALKVAAMTLLGSALLYIGPFEDRFEGWPSRAAAVLFWASAFVFLVLGLAYLVVALRHLVEGPDWGPARVVLAVLGASVLGLALTSFNVHTAGPLILVLLASLALSSLATLLIVPVTLWACIAKRKKVAENDDAG